MSTVPNNPRPGSQFNRRDFLKLGGAALLAAAMPPRLRASSDAPAFDPSIIYHGTRKFPKVALTFDDCWHPEILQQLMDILAPYPDFHFTFFAVGDAVDIDEVLKPGVWKSVHERGHEIGYHTYHHVDPQVMSTSALLDDYDQWMNTMQRVLGFAPRVHFARPPFDDLSLSFQELCRRRGMVATLYSAGFEATSVEDSARLISRTENGDIVQMHTYQDPAHKRFDLDITAQAVPYLAEQGFTLVTMSQLYDDVLREQYSSDGCDIGVGSSPTRTCLQ